MPWEYIASEQIAKPDFAFIVSIPNDLFQSRMNHFPWMAIPICYPIWWTVFVSRSCVTTYRTRDRKYIGVLFIADTKDISLRHINVPYFLQWFIRFWINKIANIDYLPVG